MFLGVDEDEVAMSLDWERENGNRWEFRVSLSDGKKIAREGSFREIRLTVGDKGEEKDGYL